MPAQDTTEIKDKILFILEKRGPSLPIHISHEVKISPLFAAAFLSELVSEKRIKISFMRVGNSPLYFLHGQEPLLERFSHHLKSREKDAFELLQNKKFLRDVEQHPAIRVALRSIRDFAIPFRKNDEIFWRYFTVPETEVRVEEKSVKKPEEKELDIFEKKEEPKKKITRKRKPQKKDDKFFNRVKEFLSKKSIEISDIESFSKSELILRIKSNGKERLLVAYNKKRINETDIIKANKKASEVKLQYTILSLGGPLKKLTNLIEALTNLSEIETLK